MNFHDKNQGCAKYKLFVPVVYASKFVSYVTVAVCFYFML